MLKQAAKINLQQLGLKVVSVSGSICAVLSNHLGIKDPSDLCVDIGKFLESHYLDDDLSEFYASCTNINVLIADLRNGWYEGADEALSCMAFARMYGCNVLVYGENGTKRQYPIVDHYKNAVKVLKLSPMKFALLRERGPHNNDGKSNKETVNKFEKSLLEQGFEIEVIPGDGNCLYTSLVKGMNSGTPESLRAAVAKFATDSMDDPNVSAHFVGLSEKMLNEKLEKIKNDKSKWGDELTIYATSKIFGINIHVYQPGTPPIKYPNDEIIGSQIISVSYHGRRHYNLLHPLGSRRAYDEISSCVVSRGSEMLCVYILLYGVEQVKTLEDHLNLRTTDTIYMMADVDMKMGTELLEDEEVQKHFTVWRCSFGLPNSGDARNNCYWVFKLMVLPLILTCSRKQWESYELGMLFDKSEDSLMMMLLNKVWGPMKYFLMDELKRTSSVFCRKCDLECTVRSEPWHWDLSRFKRAKFSHPKGHSFMTRYNFTESRDPIENNVFGKLREIYWNNVAEMDEVLKVLDENHKLQSTT